MEEFSVMRGRLAGDRGKEGNEEKFVVLGMSLILNAVYKGKF